MLHAIKLENFKCFREKQVIPLKPITLLYGPNSSGKSSIIQALVGAKHAIKTGNVDVHQADESVDLGGFHQFVHGRNAKHRVGVEFIFNAVDNQGLDLGFFSMHLALGLDSTKKPAVLACKAKDEDGFWGQLARNREGMLMCTEINAEHGVAPIKPDTFLTSFAVS
jgi:energy-coupling factor transporter ATP-binding protein EcfA2